MMKYKKIILITLFFVSTNALFGKDFGGVKVDDVTSIYDGDTFRVNINSYPSIVGSKMAIRVSGVDTPEMRGACQKEKQLARKAKEFTVDFLRSCNEGIYLKSMQRGKYFRIVADVYCGDSELSSGLISNNLAVPYNGGTKIKNWCK